MVDTFSLSSFNVVVLRSSLTTVSAGKPISTFSEVLKKWKKPLKNIHLFKFFIEKKTVGNQKHYTLNY